MTRAPANLLAVRSLLLTHLNVDKDTARADDLEPADVGIVGDAAHVGEGDSYHLGTPEQDARGSYSVMESPRDRALTDLACALDVGEFEVTVGGRTYDLAHFSAWCVGQCRAGAADTRDIREIIWSPDGRTVKRWDRLGRRTTGDSSHRWHTHFSFHRDAIKAGRDQTPLFRRYLTTIGLLEDPDMITPDDRAAIATEVLGRRYRDYVAAPDGSVARPVSQILLDARTDAARALAQVAALRAEVAQLAGRDLVDEQQLAAELAPALLAALTPEAIAGAIPPELARQVADELAARLAG